MPSRFEPCGLNQLFSPRISTVPVVHRTGGLADTVIDAGPAQARDDTATGFVFDETTPAGRAGRSGGRSSTGDDPGVWWEQLAVNGMRQDYSWAASARRYEELYEVARGLAAAD